MTRDELKEALCEEYGVEYHYENGKIVIDDTYEWGSGCYINNQWLSLKHVYYVLYDLCEEDE